MSERNVSGIKAGIFGIICNMTLAASKFIVAILSGSVSLLADAANNFFDSISCITSIIGFRISAKAADKEQVLALALKGNEISSPADIIRDPYVFEFLGLPEDKPMLENDLEAALVQQIEKFLLELGRGFMFVGTQQRVTINNTHYYVDMVFYNKILRAYVLIELKTTKLTPEAAGQINMYLNYYASEVNDADDNPPIGIILCTDKDSVTAEYALGGLENNIFASRYVLYMPNKEQLVRQIENVLENWHKDDNF